MKSLSLRAYRENREQLLAEILETIQQDERFVAAWLTGSYSRSNQDALSDVDISIVVGEKYSDLLCRRLSQVSAQTTAERMDLFEQFGEIAFLHENNHNAPAGGTFTCTIYAKTARRSSPSKLIFERINVPEEPPKAIETLEQRAEKASEITAFFWMMTTVTVKYLVREDGVFVVASLEELHKMLREIKRLVAGEEFQYKGGSVTTIKSDYQSQIETIYKLGEEMEGLMPELEQIGGFVRPSPMETLEILLSFANLTIDSS